MADDIHTVREMYFAEIKPLLKELESRERSGGRGSEADRISDLLKRFERVVWRAAGEDPDWVG